MRDIEILVRYIAFAFFLPEHEGNLKNFLDFTCKQLNEEWGKREEEIKAQMRKFESAVTTGISVFGENGFGSRWDSEEGMFTGRRNKAILDVELFYFSDSEIAKKASRRKKAVVEGFKRLWVGSVEFRNSVESTTKSLGATSTRLSLWGSELKKVLGLDFNIPELKKKRIKFSGFW